MSKKEDKVEITIVRKEGADGVISCLIKTEPLAEGKTANNAIANEDYVPKEQRVQFLHGETEQTIFIQLFTDKAKERKKIEESPDGVDDGEESEDEEVMFKVKLYNPQPEEVKISSKNVCFVTIFKNEDEEKELNDHQKILEYYLSQKEETWGGQFKKAVMLGP